MRLRDLFDPERVTSFLMRLAVCLIVFSIFLQLAVCLVGRIPPATKFGILCVFFLLSPLAYFIRQWRRGGNQRPEGRRGAERTPLLPQNEEMQ